MKSTPMVPQVKGTIAWAELDGEVVLYDEITGSMHLLDRQAAAIWVRIDGVASVDVITADVIDIFHGDETEIGGDVADFVDQLIAKGIIEEV